MAQEPNCKIEQQKLLWVLSRYKFYRHNIDKMNERIKRHPDEIDGETLKDYMKEMPLYEEIRPAKK